uniref:Uncharacterized protein n=1 Tax=Aegilops tauschii subsp. strangulata TaxID=200361 RepID=A0A453JI20_AEGTS
MHTHLHLSPNLMQIGWPTSLPTSEKGSFTKSVLREKVDIYFYQPFFSSFTLCIII